MATKAHPTSKQHAAAEKAKAGEDQESPERFDPSALKAELAALHDTLKEELKAELAQMRGATSGAVQGAQETVQRTTRSLVEVIRQNPAPLALTGAGLAWMLASARGPRRNGAVEHERRSEVEGKGEEVKRKGEQVAERASQIAQQARDSIGSVTHAAGDRVGSAARAVQRRGRELGTTVGDRLEDNPWWIGAATAAAGALLALAAPGTRREDQVMGGTRDRVIDRARSLAHGALDKIQSAAEQVEETAAKVAGKRSET